MSSSELLKNYDLAEGTIRSLYDSRLRLAILDALRDNPLRLADLRRIVNANAPNTSSKAKDLEDMGLIERTGGDFILTPFGKAALNIITKSADFFAAYEKLEKFLKPRDLSGVPSFLVERLDELEDCEIIYDDPSNLEAVYDRFYRLMDKSEKFGFGLISILHPDWATVMFEKANEWAESGIIITPDVRKGFVNFLRKNRKRYAKNSNLMNFFEIPKDVGVIFAVTDAFFDVNFKLKNVISNYMEADLLSEDPRAIKWGLDLFDYYKKQAKPVKLSDYL